MRINLKRYVFLSVVFIIFLKCLWIAFGTGVLLTDHEERIEQEETFFQHKAKTEISKTKDENVKRQSRLREYCMKHNEMEISYRVRTLTSPKFDFIYCRVNKAASTFTIQTLSTLFTCPVECMRSAAENLYSLPQEDIRNKSEQAYKFMFVREPYSRLFSAYTNKFYFPKGNWEPVGPEIVRKYRQNPSADSLKYGHDVTFAEVIKYVVEMSENGQEKTMDEHLRPMNAKCNPCGYKYDFLGKVETETSDWRYLAHELQSRNIIKDIPSTIGKKNNKEIFNLMKWFRLTLNKVKQSNISVESLYARAWTYYKLSGYISKEIPIPTSNLANNEDGTDYFEVFSRALKDALASSASDPHVKGQKKEAMLQAYSTLSIETLERLRNVVLKDCLMFGYDDRPDWLFDRKTGIRSDNTTQYFKSYR